MDLGKIGFMPSVSPPTSPTAQQKNAPGTRPPTMKRHSSASSAKSRNDLTSPGSSDGHLLQHKPRKAGGRHARVVLPRNHSSGRNLARLAQQTQRASELEAIRKHTHRRSHEGDTEIRLPGSLDESRPPPPPPAQMRRNMTTFNLPRNTSHATLKKNLSHGQLSRVHSGRNLTTLNSNSNKTPQSPGSASKGKSKRPKSSEIVPEKDLHQQEVELLEQQQQQAAAQKVKPKRVGFAVGSTDMSSDDSDDSPEMEGSGLEDEEWTEDSNSASPYSTKQNTANNSRRTSVVMDKPPDKPERPVFNEKTWETRQKEHLKKAVESAKKARAEAEKARRETEADEAESSTAVPATELHDDDDEDTEELVTTSEEPSPGSTPLARRDHRPEPIKQTLQLSPRLDRKSIDSQVSMPESTPTETLAMSRKVSTASTITPPKIAKAISPLAAAKSQQQDPTRRLLNQRTQQPAPALVSNINTLDDTHSTRGSPAQSIQGSRTDIGGANGASEENQDEFVSRFLPSQSHPSFGSGANTAYNTPKQVEFHSPEELSTLGAQHRERVNSSTLPTSPGSTLSGSSGAATPAAHRSRIDMKMALEKHQAKIESEAERQPLIPVHVYDRRNESLKSWLNLNSLNPDGRQPGDRNSSFARAFGPELFQGRFKAVNQELKVVQKYQDPVRDVINRLKQCRGSALAHRSIVQPAPQKPPGQHQAATLRLSKSAVSLPQRQNTKLSGSVSPPSGKSESPAKSTLSSAANATAAQEGPGGSASGGIVRGPPKRAVSFKETGETRDAPPRSEPRRQDERQGEDEGDKLLDIVQKLWDLPQLRQTTP